MSAQSLRQVRNWFTTCLEKHSLCSQSTGRVMPAMLLEINKRNGVRRIQLIDTAAIGVTPYAALSYCWGGDQQLKTTKATADRLKSGIELIELPQTIQDAVFVTYNLGVSFLWVDSLCIIQEDDSSAVASEIDAMGSIYGNAIVTLLASSSSSVHGGFLKYRNYPTRCFELAHKAPDGTMTRVNLIVTPSYSTAPKEPLDTRAWGLQERLLSPRVLDYRTSCTRWTCREHPTEDALLDGFEYPDPYTLTLHSATLSGFPFRKTFRREAYVERREQRHNDNALRNIFRVTPIKHLLLWHAIVETYSYRHLTVSLDRLPALSGMARPISSALQSPYCAGLWGPHLAYELLWSKTGDTLAPRPMNYQSPSWSWASINTAVQFPEKGARWYLKQVYLQTFTIVDCQVQPQDTLAPSAALYLVTSPSRDVFRRPYSVSIVARTLFNAGPMT